MIKLLIISSIGLGAVGAGTHSTFQNYVPNAVELTAGPVAFRASISGITTLSSETQELSISVHSECGQLIKFDF